MSLAIKKKRKVSKKQVPASSSCLLLGAASHAAPADRTISEAAAAISSLHSVALRMHGAHSCVASPHSSSLHGVCLSAARRHKRRKRSPTLSHTLPDPCSKPEAKALHSSEQSNFLARLVGDGVLLRLVGDSTRSSIVRGRSDVGCAERSAVSTPFESAPLRAVRSSVRTTSTARSVTCLGGGEGEFDVGGRRSGEPYPLALGGDLEESSRYCASGVIGGDGGGNLEDNSSIGSEDGGLIGDAAGATAGGLIGDGAGDSAGRELMAVMGAAAAASSRFAHERGGEVMGAAAAAGDADGAGAAAPINVSSCVSSGVSSGSMRTSKSGKYVESSCTSGGGVMEDCAGMNARNPRFRHA